MSRLVVNVATDSWVKGQYRLSAAMSVLGEQVQCWHNSFPPGCPPHRTHGILAAQREQDCIPYAFKGFALKAAADAGHTSLLWCDACIVPLKPLDELWKKIERDGVWFARNGFTNYQWTAADVYQHLFPDIFATAGARVGGGTVQHADCLASAMMVNRCVPHVVATTFGLNLNHPKGTAFLAEYYRLASETRAFCGPWQNSAAPREQGRNSDRPAGYCGPPDVLGHRHDQSAASVIAWRLGVELTDSPKWFAYEGGQTDETVLVARGI